MNLPAQRPAPLHWLTVLRYPATLWVIMKHSLHNFGDPAAIPESLRKSFMERGFLGVPFFFILSGFILTYNYPVIRSKLDYLAARAGRILPVYYLSLLLSLPLILPKFAHNGIHFALPRTLTYLTLTQAWIPDFTGFWNFPTWTLSCEAFFYVLLLWMLAPLQNLIAHSPKRASAIIAGCFVFGLVSPAVFTIHFGNPPLAAYDNPANAELISAANFVKIFPILHLLEFVTGVALCLGLRTSLPSLARFSGLLMLLGSIQVLSCLFIPAIFSQGTYCLPGFVLFILGAAALPFPKPETSEPGTKWLASKSILLGQASYGVYLFHIPVMFTLLAFARHLFPILPNGEAGVWTLYIATILITTALAIPIYYYYEQPARRHLSQWVRRRWSHPGRAAKSSQPEQESDSATGGTSLDRSG
jgi:peptidoglycan/LPS O-acetylase OafA/YrhL